MKVLILRPQPGADETAARAKALGLNPVVAPMFTVRALPWSPPSAAACDAVLLTSANAPRLGGDAMTPFVGLPCYAVGESTAEAARTAGFAEVRTGPSDGAEMLAKAAADGVAAALHLCGREHIALTHPGVAVTAIPVYAAEAAGDLPGGIEDMLALLHSPRAAAAFAALAGDRRGRIRLAAISAQTAAAAGDGWALVGVAEAPRDEALLALAAKLCQN